MNAEYVSAIGAAGAAVGAIVNEKVSSPITGSGLIPFVVGAVIAAVAWKFIDMDGVGDFVEGFGIGMAIDAVV
ncbi:MAG: hypothetical protein QXW39_06195 [Candidatus Bathyarchaeia archaeon]